jgi:hypothetical protein
MIRSLIAAGGFILAAILCAAAQSPDAAPPAQSGTSKPAASAGSAATPQKKKPKVWTNDEVSKINGNVSVIGGAQASSSSASPSSSSENAPKDPSGQSSREKQLAGYRDKLRGLRTQLEETDKKISDLRNFKGDNSSASGGINMNQGYSMTPVADQIKQLEAKRGQIQDQIDSVESDARKNGFDPGELR